VGSVVNVSVNFSQAIAQLSSRGHIICPVLAHSAMEVLIPNILPVTFKAQIFKSLLQNLWIQALKKLIMKGLFQSCRPMRSDSCKPHGLKWDRSCLLQTPPFHQTESFHKGKKCVGSHQCMAMSQCKSLSRNAVRVKA